MPAAKRTAKSRSNSTRDRCTTAGTGDHGQILGERQEHQAMVDAKYRFMALLWLHQSGRDRGCYALSLEEEIEVQGKLLCAGKSVGVVYVGFRKKRTGKLMAQARHTEYLAVSSRSRGFPSVVR